MRAVVTAGGTSEPLDDVRVITNRSTGRFGAALAVALADAGCDVTLVTSGALPDDRRIRVVPFASFADLSATLDAELATPVDLVWMAAAVSDYTPVATPGKISSAAPELTIHLTANPKLLGSLRTRVGEGCTLVGFKLLSGVGADHLLAVARRQVVDNALDGCLANDLAELRDGQHPAWFVPRDADPIRIEGTKAQVARALGDAVLPPSGEVPELGIGVDLRGLPGLDGARHLPRSLTLPTVEGTFRLDDPAPLRAALARRAWIGAWSGGGWSAALGPIGCLVGWSAAAHGIQRRRWADTLAVWRSTHGAGSPRDPAPVVDQDRIVGVCFHHDGATGVWLRPDARGVGRGDRLLQRLDTAGRAALGPPAAEDWFAHRGWRPIAAHGDRVGPARVVFEPPSRRADLRAAASACLLDPVRRRVLIGCRRTPPWLGFWAFPGGSREGDEPLADTALRELAEETGIVLDEAATLGIHRITAGVDPGYAVTCFVLAVFDAPDPAVTDELAARWVSLDEAVGLAPMAAGTRRIVRALHSHETTALGRPGAD